MYVNLSHNNCKNPLVVQSPVYCLACERKGGELGGGLKREEVPIKKFLHPKGWLLREGSLKFKKGLNREYTVHTFIALNLLF